MGPHHAEQVGQPDDVIEMGVGEEDVEFRRGQIFAGPIDGRSGVEHHAALRQQQARRLPPVVGMIAGGAEEDEPHERVEWLRGQGSGTGGQGSEVTKYGIRSA